MFTRGFLFLPEMLYSLGERPLLLEFDELQVENRNVDFYQGNTRRFGKARW